MRNVTSFPPEPMSAKTAAFITVLNALLADAITLKQSAKQAHWNVKGMQFISLHELFDRVATAADDYADLLAERIVQLGGIAMGTVHYVAENVAQTEYPVTASSGLDHVIALSNLLHNCALHSKGAIQEAERLDDPVSADIATQITAGLDKLRWFVDAHKG